MPSIRQRRQRRSRQIRRLIGGGRRSRRGTGETVVVQDVAAPTDVAVLTTGEEVLVGELTPSDQVVEVVAANGGGRSRKLRRGGRRASKTAQRGGRAVSLKTAVRLLRNYYAKRYA